MRKRWTLGIGMVLCGVLLVSGVRLITKIYSLTQTDGTGIYKLSETMTVEETEKIFEKEKEQEESVLAARLVFWGKEENQTVENPEFSRSITGTVYVLCGDSNLIWKESYPLDWEDKRGCLIGEKLALQLFGSDKVVGETVAWKNQKFQIRGIIRGEECLVMEGIEEQELSNLTIRGENETETDRNLEYMAMNHGVEGIRINSPMLAKKDMPKKVSDVTGWVEFFKKQKKIWDRNH